MAELRIEYTQNGRTISDESFKTVAPGTGFDCGEISHAKQAAIALVEKMGCGTTAVYVKSDAGRRYIASFCTAADHVAAGCF